MYKKSYHQFRIGNNTSNFFIEEYYNKHKNSSKKIFFEIFPKLLINNPHTNPHQHYPKNLTTPTITQPNNRQSSTRIYFQDNPYTFEARHARLSEPLEAVVRRAPLSEPQNEPVFNIYPPLQQDLNRARYRNQNQNTLEKK